MNKNFIIGTALLIFGILLTFTAIVKSDEYSSGETLFKKNCQFCHHIKGDDNYASAYYLQFRPKDFSDPDSWKGLNEQKITQVIQKGKRVMPAINLTPDEIKAINDYMTHKLKR
ncbi:MAG: cytochrome c [Syntrophales bacterium LBB04]|nr:cytochrome c [Syntrophales bacterium LBB04]